jgi:hypothetical protein
VVVHSEDEETNTAPTGSNLFQCYSVDQTGTTLDPYLQLAIGTPWSFVGVSSIGTPVTATPIVLTEPAGVADGDLLIACIASRTTATTAITGTGWTAVGSQNNNNTLTTGSAIASGTMLYRIRSGTPTLSFTLPATVSVAMGQIVAYRGSAATTPLDASTAVTAAAGLTPSVTGLTTTQDDDLIVAMAAGGQEAAWSAFTNVGASTWNPADKSANITLSASDQTATTTSATSAGIRSATPHLNGTAGKYYAEWLLNVVPGRAGITATSDSLTTTTTNIYAQPKNGVITVNNANVGSFGTACVNTDVLCMAWDAGAETIWFRKNAGNWNNDAAANPATGTGGLDCSYAAASNHALWMQCAVSGESTTLRTLSSNFTQAVPSGFAAWDIGTGPLTASGATDTTTAPSTTAWIERADNVTTSGADTSLGIFDAVRTSTGATGNLSVTASVSAGHVIIAGAFKIAAPSGGVSANVTGQELTASVGTATVSLPKRVDVTGQQIAVSVDSVTVSGKANVSTTGQAVTASVGTVTATGKATATLAGQELAASVGTVTVSLAVGTSASVTGQEVAVSVGTVTVTGKATANVTGQALTTAVGTATATGKATASVTGQEVTAAVGTATVVGKATATLTGQEIASAVGSVTVSAVQKATADVTGQQVTALVNGVSVTAGGSVSVSLTGQQLTASVGTATVTAIAGTVGVWNGTSWVQKPAKVWTGSAWVQKPVKTWNGTSWAA